MNNDLISRSALIDTFSNTVFFDEDSKCKALELIDNAPTVNPCENCDLYFMAMTKEVDNVRLPELYQGCSTCDAHNRCPDAFCSNAVNCNAYEKGGAENDK